MIRAIRGAGAGRCAAALLGVCVFSIGGCGESETAGHLPTHPAHGEVRFNAMPIPDATLAFYPVVKFPTDVLEAIPRAKVDANGKFKIETYNSADGAPAGDYRVTVSWQGPLQGINDESGDDNSLPELLPEKYQDPLESGLLVHINEGENEIPVINLEAMPEE